MHRKLGQRRLQLLVNQFHSGTQLGRVRLHLQSALQAIQHRQQRLDRICRGVIAKLLLLLAGAPARIFKLGLRPRQPVEQRVALGL